MRPSTKTPSIMFAAVCILVTMATVSGRCVPRDDDMAEVGGFPINEPCDMFTGMRRQAIRLMNAANATYNAFVDQYPPATRECFYRDFTLEGLVSGLRMPYLNWTNLGDEAKIGRIYEDLLTFQTYLREVRHDERHHAEYYGIDSLNLLNATSTMLSRLQHLVIKIRVTEQPRLCYSLPTVDSSDVMTADDKDPTSELRVARDHQVLNNFRWFLRWVLSDLTALRYRHCAQE